MASDKPNSRDLFVEIDQKELGGIKYTEASVNNTDENFVELLSMELFSV